jgi:hypothetical protein
LKVANQDELLTGSIDDYLLGLADGIQKAQRQLSQMALVVQPGEAPVTYQIPRVDFELKMSFEMTTVPSDEGDGTAGSSALRFRPAGGRRGGSSTSTEASSIIRGSFVAVPVHGGKPPPVIRTTLRRISSHKLEITVSVTSAAGEKLSGVEVQFNVDRDLSRKLTPIANAAYASAVFDTSTMDGASFDQPADLQPGTKFWDGLVTTNEEGLAAGVLNVDPLEPAGTRVAAIVDVLGKTDTIVFKAE